MILMPKKGEYQEYQCKVCGKRVYGKAKRCPRCGARGMVKI